MFVDQSVNVKEDKISKKGTEKMLNLKVLEDSFIVKAAEELGDVKGLEEGKVVENFECCRCGSKKYKAIIKHNHKCGPGFSSWVAHYECEGCSVFFGDPEKFSKAKEKIL